ncbi:MAG: hypothetical protein ACJZ9B_03800 [Coraliomargaritaceae bacterium]
MKKTLILISTVCLLSLMNFTAHAVSVDASSTGNWSATRSGNTLTLAPNTNTYADNINGDAAANDYWSNSPDGGLTMGPVGGKYMQAIYKLESGTDWARQSLNLSGTIDSNTLDSRYSLYVFGKTLVNNVWSEHQYERVSLSSGAAFSFDFNVDAGDHVAQIGLILEGSNANPED